jgi:hypothetical protein
MARSKQDKAAFIANLRAGADALKDQGVTPPSNLLDSFSPSNALMIILQKPNATQCAGFHAWKAAGRSVKKGSRGAAILVPIGADDDGDLRFTWRYVFDISDTEELTDSSPRLARDLAVA